MADARERLTLLREKYLPDIESRKRAARQLITELSTVADGAKYVVHQLDNGIVISLPTFAGGAHVLAIDGEIFVFDPDTQRQIGHDPSPLDGLEYDPVHGHYVSEDARPPVDLLAEAVATILEAQLPPA